MPARKKSTPPKKPSKKVTKKAVSKKKLTKSKSSQKASTAAKAKKSAGGLKPSNNFPIVGIGSSAGGLEALELFFSNVPPDKNVAILNRRLHLMEPTQTHGVNLPIDCFFRSLSEDQAEKAICIILSGTATDGTLGLKAIKGEGGMAMVQDPNSAKYAGMPSTGHDFSNYKQTTIRRRIERRMAPYRTLENVIDGVVLTFVDIGKLKELNQLNRLATVVRDSNDAITVQDLNGNITAWNKGAQQMYGWSEAEALEMNIRDIIPENKINQAKTVLKKMKKGENVKPFETQRRCKDGKNMVVWLTVTALKDEKGRPVEIATTERDVGELKQLRKAADSA